MHFIDKAVLFVILGVLVGILYSQEKEEARTSFHIKYVSAENVYLDAGSTAGLAKGDQLAVKKNNVTIAEIEVQFVAENSASCKIIKSFGMVETGDLAIITKKMAVPQQPKAVEQQPVSPPEAVKVYRKRASTREKALRLSGSISLQYYHWHDQNSTGLDFTQPTARLNLRARRLWGKEYNLRIRTRARHNQRARSLNEFAPQQEWRNRVYELAISYDNEDALFNFQAGRIISNKFSGVGYIDGLLVQHNLTGATSYGIFGGTQPQWQYSDFQTSIQKYGLYFNYHRGNYSTNRFESTVAAAGEYHGSIVSREFLYFQNSYYSGRAWSFYQSAELDINRDWRKQQAGQSISLTNLYLSGRWNPLKWLGLGLMFDNRKNYQTYETRSLADSLFDDALRYGLRGSVSLLLPNSYRIFSNFGVRKRKTDAQYTYSYAGGLNKSNFLFRGTSIFANAAGFSNFFTNGVNFGFRLGQLLFSNYNVDIGYGGYTYQVKSNSTTRKNNWVRAGGWGNLFTHYYISGEYEHDWGDDTKGYRILAEIGYRF